MRSYEAARSLFSFLGFVAWSVVVIGVLVALVSAGGVGRYAGGGAGLLAMVPGIGIGITGFILVAFVQMGRATVDTAEYTQQMLKVARGQLEVSKQGLSQGKALEQGFAALKQPQEENPATSFSDAKARETPRQKELRERRERLEKPAEPSQERVALGLEDGVLTYAGQTIQVKSGKFLTATMAFSDFKAARNYIDQLAVNPNATRGGVKR